MGTHYTPHGILKSRTANAARTARRTSLIISQRRARRFEAMIVEIRPQCGVYLLFGRAEDAKLAFYIGESDDTSVMRFMCFLLRSGHLHKQQHN
jgi:hypothetical protein